MDNSRGNTTASLHIFSGSQAEVRTNSFSVSGHLLAFVVLPLCLLIVLTFLFWITNADLAICSFFFEDGVWTNKNAPLLRFFYDYAAVPGLFIGIGALLIWAASWALQARLGMYRKPAAFLALALLIGPGLAVNGIFKPHYNRPRPVQIEQFGGVQPFVQVWGTNWEENCRSFPSGHASMGFFLMVPAFLLRRKAATAFFLVGIASGAVVGLVRIAQGAHFPSDVLWSGGMVYFTGLVLAYLFGFHGIGHTAFNSPANSADDPDVFSIDDYRESASEPREQRRAA